MLLQDGFQFGVNGVNVTGADSLNQTVSLYTHSSLPSITGDPPIGFAKTSNWTEISDYLVNSEIKEKSLQITIKKDHISNFKKVP